MNIETDKIKNIFRYDKDGKAYYSIGLSKKDKDGNYINGYMNCKFPKEAEVPNKSKIKIHEAWIDFYVKDKVTYPYVFINKYEMVEDIKEEIPQNIKTDYEENGIVINENDLPF